MKQIKMGALFLDNVEQTNPQKPTYDGDIPRYDGTSTITITEAPKNRPDTFITWNIVPNMEKWSRTGTLLIADRALLRNVSWDDLAAAGFVDGVEVVLKGRKYRCRLLQIGELPNSPNAWDDALNQTTENDDIWHWKDMHFWGRDTASSRKTNRGFYSARRWNWYVSSSRSAYLGFRPALEPLELDNLFDDAVELSTSSGIKVIIRDGIVESVLFHESVLFNGEDAPSVEVVDINDAYSDYEKLKSYADELYDDAKYREIPHTMASFCDDEGDET